jgi:hypothetical protein
MSGQKEAMVFVEVEVEAVPLVPHQRVDLRLEREVRLLVLVVGVLVVDDVGQLRHVEGGQSHLRVEVDGVAHPVARGVLHHRGRERHGVQPVLLAEGGLDPLVVPFQNGQHLADPLFDPQLVVDVELGPGEKRRKDPLGIIIRTYGLAVFLSVLPANRPRVLLLGVEVVQQGQHGVDAVGVHEEERRETGVELVDPGAVRVGEIPAVQAVRRGPLLPEVPHKDPGFIVQSNEILIVEMYLWEVLPYHSHSSCFLRYCTMPAPAVKVIFCYRRKLDNFVRDRPSQRLERM